MFNQSFLFLQIKKKLIHQFLYCFCIHCGYKLKSFKIRKSAVEEFLKENEGNDLSDLENIKRINGEE